MDVLRENIGLLQLPYEDEYLNEFNLPFRKKSRWQRFKDAIKNNRGKIAAGAGLLGGLIGKDYINYRSMVKGLEKNGFKKQKDGSYFRSTSFDDEDDNIKTGIGIHDRVSTHFRITNPLKPTPNEDRYISGNTYFTYKGKRFDDLDVALKAFHNDRNDSKDFRDLKFN